MEEREHEVNKWRGETHATTHTTNQRKAPPGDVGDREGKIDIYNIPRNKYKKIEAPLTGRQEQQQGKHNGKDR